MSASGGSKHLLEMLAAAYPPSNGRTVDAARKAGVHGNVRIATILLPDGSLDYLVVLSAPSRGLAVPALVAVRRLRYFSYAARRRTSRYQLHFRSDENGNVEIGVFPPRQKISKNAPARRSAQKFVVAEQLIIGQAETAGLFEQFDGWRRFRKKSERRGGCMPHVVRVQERLGLAMQRDMHEMRRFGPFAPQSPQERLARVEPRVIRQRILRRLNSRLGVIQLPRVNKNRGLKYVGPDVDRIVAKSALETFLGLFEVPHAQGGVA